MENFLLTMARYCVLPVLGKGLLVHLISQTFLLLILNCSSVENENCSNVEKHTSKLLEKHVENIGGSLHFFAYMTSYHPEEWRRLN